MFSAIKSDREVEVARTASVAARTHKDTKYCVGLWESWREWRQSENKDSIEPIEKLSKDKIQICLSRFVLEISKKKLCCPKVL